MDFWLLGASFGIGLFIGAGMMSPTRSEDMPATGVVAGLTGFVLAMVSAGVLFANYFASHLAWVP